MTKPIGKFINLSEDWELNYCLKKYDFAQSKKNQEILIDILVNKVKPYFNLKSSDNLTWEQIDLYQKNVGFPRKKTQ